MNIKEYLDNQSATLRVATVFCLVVLIGFIDYLTGFEISLAVFYLIPIFIATWYVGKRFGFFVAVISSLTWFMSDYFAGHAYSNDIFAYWNAAVQFGFFIFFTVILSSLREINEKLNKKIIDYKQSEEALKNSENQYRSLVESTEDSIYVLDRDHRYLFMNKQHLSRLGIADSRYLGQYYGDFHSTENTKDFMEVVDKVFMTGESVRHDRKSERDDKYFLLTLSPVKEPEGKVSAVTVVSKDITDLKKMEERLRALSLTDELTGIYNRRGFFIMAEQVLKLSRRQKRGVFMLYADMDNLKEINDTLGHQEGDRALIDTANILKATYRETDIVARIGGDEFVVIPVGSTGDNIKVISARLQENLETHNVIKSRNYSLSVSSGISYYNPESPCSIDELLKQAEKLMYEEKMLKRLS